MPMRVRTLSLRTNQSRNSCCPNAVPVSKTQLDASVQNLFPTQIRLCRFAAAWWAGQIRPRDFLPQLDGGPPLLIIPPQIRVCPAPSRGCGSETDFWSCFEASRQGRSIIASRSRSEPICCPTCPAGCSFSHNVTREFRRIWGGNASKFRASLTLRVLKTH